MSPPGRPASPRMRSAEQPTSPQAATVVQPVPRRSHAIERIISHREPSPKQSATEDLHKAYREAKEWLISAQLDFDTRDRRREKECETNARWLEQSGGTYGMPPEELDLQWVAKISRITRKLINAEEAFKSAKAAAVNGGCEVSDIDLNSESEDDSESDSA